MEKLSKVIGIVKNKRAIDTDGVSSWFIKQYTDEVMESIQVLVNISFPNGILTP